MNFITPNVKKRMSLRFCFSFFLKICLVVWIIGLADNVQWNEDGVNKKIEFLDFCKSVELDVLAYPDTKMNTITVTFELVDSKFKKCFQYYYIFLEREKETVKEYKIWNEQNKEEKFSCTFENITCGVYEVAIQPCYDYWECALIIIRHEMLMNMSSSDCIPQSVIRKSLPVPILKAKVVISLAVASVILIIVVSGLIYRYYWSALDRRMKKERFEFQRKLEKFEIVPKKIHVHIFNFYDKNEKMKEKVGILKDYLEKSLYFNSVKEIEDDLAYILFDVNEWLNDMLKKKDENGYKIKIILIDSEDFQDEEYELESFIYTKFIEKLSNNTTRCLTDYDSLFVARLDGITTYSKRLRDIVRRDRYVIPRDLNDLCLNLSSSISELDFADA